MKNMLKWVGIVVGGLVALVLLIIVGLLAYGQLSWKPKINRDPVAIVADTSAEGIARGEYLVTSVMGCADCHSSEPGAPDLAGRYEVLEQGPMRVEFAPPNLTPHEQTGLGAWTDAEIARAIREGIGRDGRALVVMSSFNYHVLSDADVAAIIGYLRSIDPVENEIPPFDASAAAKTAYALGMLGPKSVGEPITDVQTTPAITSPEYGVYMTTLSGCRDCHGMDFTGNAIPLAEPGTPYAPNLTSHGALGKWTEAEFIATLRTGTTPNGRTLNEIMPWRVYGQMSDDDLGAIYRYLVSLPLESAGQ